MQVIAPPCFEDDAIRELAASNRQAAMDAVVRKHRDRLFRHAAHILRDNDQAWDVCQEVFIKAMHEPRFFDDGFRMGAWLYRVTSNLCLNLVRNRRRRTDILHTYPQRQAHEAQQPEVVEAAEKQSQLQDALGRLSGNHRRILEERFYHDLSYSEIAEVLDIKLGTVMSRLSRAKDALMQVLDGSVLAER